MRYDSEGRNKFLEAVKELEEDFRKEALLFAARWCEARAEKAAYPIRPDRDLALAEALCTAAAMLREEAGDK